MQQTILVEYRTFAADQAFRLLEKPVRCCGKKCQCEGFDGRNLLYRCPTCHTQKADPLELVPLFAQDLLEAATIQHFEIACPYCGGRAPLVGGSFTKGLYFVCEQRCHTPFARTIRRY